MTARPGPKDRVLHLVGNAHIDPVWLWQWPEGLAEVRATFRSALDRMVEYPDFIFTAGSAAYYDWVERTDPSMFEEIRSRVAERRWEIVGGWWVEPDCNLPGGESFVRQALLGQRYFESRFGRTATVGYNVDSFGHAATLPQLLRQAGLEHYVFMRPQPHELELPGEVFWWEGPDGSRVLAARIPHEYSGPRGALAAFVETAVAKIPPGARESLVFYGVGNHGGGPTKANIDSLHALDADPAAPRLVLSSPERYFAAIRAELERGDVELTVWRGELQHHARGCYSAHAAVKRWDRAAERALVTAETIQAVATQLLGEVEAGRRPDDPEPDRDRLDRAWRNVAFNQFHDILGGTAIEPAYDDARETYGEAMAIAGRVTHDAFQRIARRIDLPFDPDSRAIVVLNGHPWPVRAVVDLEVGGLLDDDILVDDAGEPIPHQRIQSLATASDWRRRMAFVADLPPLGYRTYRLVSGDAVTALEGPGAAPVATGALRAAESPTHITLENDSARLEIDRQTGWISSLRVATSGASGSPEASPEAELVGEGLLRAIVLDDPSDTWSHDIEAYGGEELAFEPTAVRLIETGPVRATIRIDARLGASRLRLDVSLAAGVPGVDIVGILDWHERRRVLKLRMGTSAVPGATESATVGVPFGAVLRDVTGSEEPAGPWADVSGPDAGGDGGPARGLVVVNEAKSAIDVRGGDIGITLARSPIYAHHDPRVADEANEVFSYQDQGRQRFRLRLLPHLGDWRGAEPARRAAELAQSPVAAFESFHSGSLPLTMSFAEVAGEGVVLAAMKRAEEGPGTVVRIVETLGRQTATRLRLPDGRTIEANLDPWAVASFVVPDDTTRPTLEVDLIERPIVRTSGEVTVKLRPMSILR